MTQGPPFWLERYRNPASLIAWGIPAAWRPRTDIILAPHLHGGLCCLGRSQARLIGASCRSYSSWWRVDCLGKVPRRCLRGWSGLTQARELTSWQYLPCLIMSVSDFLLLWHTPLASSSSIMGKGSQSPHLPLTPEALLFNRKAWQLVKGQIGLSRQQLTWLSFNMVSEKQKTAT